MKTEEGVLGQLFSIAVSFKAEKLALHDSGALCLCTLLFLPERVVLVAAVSLSQVYLLQEPCCHRAGRDGGEMYLQILELKAHRQSFLSKFTKTGDLHEAFFVYRKDFFFSE